MATFPSPFRHEGRTPIVLMTQTIAYNKALLLQADELLAQLSDVQLGAQRDLLFGGTIGQHVRHILEYYLQLLKEQATGRINYDRRVRDHGIEQQVSLARTALQDCLERLHDLDTDRPLTLESELPLEERTITQQTSLLRELTYVADHCVHHLAMVRIVVEQGLPTVGFPLELGVAAATRNHRAR